MNSFTSEKKLDHFQRLINHEDFHKLIVLVGKVKAVYITLSQNSGPSLTDTEMYMHKISKSIQNILKSGNEKISRGDFPTTDSLIDESIIILEQELSWCLDLQNKAGKIPKKTLAEPIAIKYSKRQTDILTQWMIDHRKHPFPTSQEIDYLRRLTGLSYSQVVNWTTNVRKRNLKATVKGGKKPHHFLDFLFLAEHRDQQRESGAISAAPCVLSPKVKVKMKMKKVPSKSSSKQTLSKPSQAKHMKESKKEINQSTNDSVPMTYIVTPPRPIHLPFMNSYNSLPPQCNMKLMPFNQHPNIPVFHPLPQASNMHRSSKDSKPGNEQEISDPSRKLNLNIIDESMEDLLNEEIMTPREDDTNWLADDLLDANTGIPVDAIKDSLLGAPKRPSLTNWLTEALLEPTNGLPVDAMKDSLLGAPKRPSLTYESIEKILELRAIETVDFEALLNSTMDDLEDDEMITEISSI